MFTFPPPERQIYVHEILVKARHSVLHDTVRAAAKTIPPAALSSEMTTYAPHPGLQLLHGSNIRDELVFAVPSVLTAAPAALGYYRLLLGVSQKLFYKTATGLNVFKSMEERGVIGPRAAPLIADLCRELNIEISALITSLSPGLTAA
ncbi:XcyI family restriction endonuclease, partial [Mycobacterium eburneum]